MISNIEIQLVYAQKYYPASSKLSNISKSVSADYSTTGIMHQLLLWINKIPLCFCHQLTDNTKHTVVSLVERILCDRVINDFC